MLFLNLEFGKKNNLFELYFILLINETNNFNVFIIGWNGTGQIGSLIQNDDDNLVDSCSNDHQTWKVYANIQYSYCGYQYIIHKSKGGIYGIGYNEWGSLGLGHTNQVNKMTEIGKDIELNKTECNIWTTPHSATTFLTFPSHVYFIFII